MSNHSKFTRENILRFFFWFPFREILNQINEMPRSRNSSTSASSGVPINVDVQDLTQTVQENMMTDLVPIDINSRPVNSDLITNNTITLHESPVSSVVNALFNSPNIGCTNPPVFQLQVFDHVDCPNLAYQQSSSSSSSSIFQSNISGNEDINITSLVVQPFRFGQSIPNTGATNTAFQQTSVTGVPGISPSAVTPSASLSTINWVTTMNSTSSSMPSLRGASDSSTVNRLADQNTTAISSIDLRPSSVTSITPHISNANVLAVPFTVAGSQVYSQIIFNVPGEQAWQFKDHVRLKTSRPQWKLIFSINLITRKQ